MISKAQYVILNQFPKNKSYASQSRIEKMSKKKLDFDLINVLHDLHFHDLLNGDYRKVGLRITDKGLAAIKEYKSLHKNPLWHEFKVAAMTAGFSILVGIILLQLERRNNNQEIQQLKTQMDTINKKVDSLSNK